MIDPDAYDILIPGAVLGVVAGLVVILAYWAGMF